MIQQNDIESAMYQAMRTASTRIPPDVAAALDEALAEESDPLAREHLRVSMDNFSLASEGQGQASFDPEGLLNPGVMFSTAPITRGMAPLELLR